MYCKTYDVDPNHVDFQGVVDGLYYPFYFEWARHAFMAEVLGREIEAEFQQGRVHLLLSYTLNFKKSLKAGDKLVVTCRPLKNAKNSRVDFYQQILVDGLLYADATFTATCLVNGRPTIPPEVRAMLG